MTDTLTREQLIKLEEHPIPEYAKNIYSYIAALKEVYELETRMSLEEKDLLKKMLEPSEKRDDFLTVDDVSKLLGISPQMVRRKCSKNQITSWRTTGNRGEWRIDINQYRTHPIFNKRLEELIKQKQSRKEKKKKLVQAVKQLSETEGYTEIFDAIDAQKGSND